MPKIENIFTTMSDFSFPQLPDTATAQANRSAKNFNIIANSRNRFGNAVEESKTGTTITTKNNGLSHSQNNLMQTFVKFKTKLSPQITH